MTSFRQIEANRANAQKSTGPVSEEGKQRSRCNAIRHGLTAETVIGTLEDAEDYEAFEAAIIADYDAQSAVERELVLRLASLLWRLRRATTIESGLFESQADHLSRSSQIRCVNSREVFDAMFGRADRVSLHQIPASHGSTDGSEAVPNSDPTIVDPAIDPNTELTRCFLRLANLPNYASIASVDMKQPFGATLARSCLHSMPWIAANRRKDGAVSASAANKSCRRMNATSADFRARRLRHC